ncbi:MAG: hypothetical protein ABR541_07285 [Candidatus Dormibacteria bacterium]
MRRLLAWVRRRLGIGEVPAPALPVRMDSPEEYWLDRARIAADRCRVAAGQARRGAVADRCRQVAGQAAASLTAIERLAGQASMVHRTLAGMNRAGLRAEQGRLRAAGAARPQAAAMTDPAPPAPLAPEVERSLAAIADQERVAARLEATHAALLRRLEASAMELEGLNAGIAEVVALAETGGEAGDERLERLSREVEGLRQGLLEAVDAGRLTIEAPRGAQLDAAPPPTSAPFPQPLTSVAPSPIVPVTDADVPRTS